MELRLEPWGRALLGPIGESLGDRFEDWHWEEYYPRYVAWSKLVKPRAILEMGVRYGYTALALLAPLAEARPLFVGIDNESYVPGSLAVASQLLAIHAPWASVRLLKQSTCQELQEAPGEFDLIHVDGDHSYEGALLDLRLALDRLAPGGVIIVDDWLDPDVKRACAEFQQATLGLTIASFWSERQGHAYFRRAGEEICR